MSLGRLACRSAVLAALLVPVAAGLAAAGADQRCESDGRYVMGTVLQVELCAARELRHEGFADVFSVAARLDDLLTTWKPDSATSRLNERAGTEVAPLPPEVVELLALSREYALVTDGTFDVTVGPLVALWRDASARGREPSADAIATARAHVGSERIALAADGAGAALRERGMSVDFGGIGKGYALDRVAARLRVDGVEHALLDFGRSSIQALDAPPGSAGWRLLLQHPSGATLGVVTLREQAMSVSGSLGQTREVGVRRYGHVVDPRSGRPLERDLLAAVVAPSGAVAEALSKALLLLGERDGIALLERLDGVEALLADADGRRWSTTGWQAAVAFEAAAGS